MIIKTDESTVETVGDVKEFKTGIDPKNLEFITTLLSSNLYSAPERSFIREIVSNAWDAHVEAGTTDTPVILKVTDNSILIRDYGTGLSPERFKDVYCNIGSSTKRETNDYIGGFGIGKYSSLACSNIVNITSYYNGIEYQYIMIKDGNNITTNLVYEKDTEERNGLQVEITNISDISSYLKALKYIIFFPNIYVDDKCINNYYYEDINKIKIKHFTNFAAANVKTDSKILLGNVLYPCKNTYLNSECSAFLRMIEYTGVVVKFNIGTLKVTPNREELIYDTDTIKVIEEHVLKAKKELADLIYSKINHNCTDIIEYYHYVSNCILFDLNKEEIVYDYSNDDFFIISTSAERLGINTKITFNGTVLDSSELNIINKIANIEIPNYKASFINGVITKSKSDYRIRKINKVGTYNYPIIIDVNRFSSIMKEYIENTYKEDTIICKKFSYEEFISLLKNEYLFYSGYDTDSTINKYNYLIKYIYNHISSKWIVEDFSSQDFLDFKESYKEECTSIELFETIKLYCYNLEYQYEWYAGKEEFNTIEEAIKFIKNIHKGVVINNINREKDELYRNICKNKGYGYITANVKTIKRLKEESFTNYISLDWLLNNDPYNSKVYTIYKYLGSCYADTFNSFFLSTIPETIRVEILDSISDIIKNDNSHLLDYLIDNPCKTDPYIEYLCKQYIKYKEKYDNLLINSTLNNYTDGSLRRVLLYTLLYKNKVYRLNEDKYKQVKHNALINLLYAREKDNN